MEATGDTLIGAAFTGKDLSASEFGTNLIVGAAGELAVKGLLRGLFGGASKGPNCFISGTQVVVRADHQSVVTAFSPPESKLAGGANSKLDGYFASVAFVLGTGLFLEQQRRKKKGLIASAATT